MPKKKSPTYLNGVHKKTRQFASVPVNRAARREHARKLKRAAAANALRDARAAAAKALHGVRDHLAEIMGPTKAVVQSDASEAATTIPIDSVNLRS